MQVSGAEGELDGAGSADGEDPHEAAAVVTSIRSE